MSKSAGEPDNNTKKTKKPKKTWKLKILFLVVVLLFLFGGLVFLGLYFKDRLLVAYSNPTVIPLPVIPPEPANNDDYSQANHKETKHKKTTQTSSDDTSSNVNADVIKELKKLSEQVSTLKQQLASREAKDSKADVLDSEAELIYRLTRVIDSEKPFADELSVLDMSNIPHQYHSSIKKLSTFARKGVLNSYHLSEDLDKLWPLLKREIYKQSSSLKYYLSYLIVSRKTANFTSADQSLDATLNFVKQSLLEDNPSVALDEVKSRKLCDYAALKDWCNNLEARVQVNDLKSQLQRSLLLRTSCKDVKP